MQIEGPATEGETSISEMDGKERKVSAVMSHNSRTEVSLRCCANRTVPALMMKSMESLGLSEVGGVRY